MIATLPRVILPRFEFPAWLRHGRERAANMLAPLGGMLTPLGVSGVAANPLASVPWVAQWKFNNDGSDSIGSNHLTNNHSATFTTGKLGGATGATRLVAASVQYWSVASNATLQMGSGVKWMISAWVNPTSYGVSNTLWSKGIYGGAEYGLFLSSTNIELYTNGTLRVTVGTPVTTAAWSLVVVWYDGTTYSIAVNNGTAVTGSSGDTNSGSGALLIGARPDALTTPYSWNGLVDDVCIAKSTSTFVTQAVLDALWNGGNGTETLA